MNRKISNKRDFQEKIYNSLLVDLARVCNGLLRYDIDDVLTPEEIDIFERFSCRLDLTLNVSFCLGMCRTLLREEFPYLSYLINDNLVDEVYSVRIMLKYE